MISAPLLNKDGGKKEMVDLSEGVFDLLWNDALVHQVVTSISSNERSGAAHTKIRSEKRGGGRKPWRQKGTGRARHGSKRSPLFVGGGVTFGPRSEKSYLKVINKKMKRKAFRTVLSKKLRENRILFVDGLSYKSEKTKSAQEFINKLKESQEVGSGSILIVMPSMDNVIRKSFNNLEGVSVTQLSTLNTKSALSAGTLVFLNPDETMEILNKEEK